MLYSVVYFNRPYTKQSGFKSIAKRTINGKVYIVYRINHGVAHSLRQGFLARDILLHLSRSYNNSISNWIREQCKKDKYFHIKVAILSSFQRSGRESECSSTNNPEAYYRYEQQDIVNFLEGTDNKYFSSEEEKELYSYSLPWSSNKSPSPFTRNLAKIIHCAHLLDLRRCCGFSKDRIFREIYELFQGEVSHETIRILWNQSAKYLAACGDTDMECKSVETDKFYMLHQDIRRMYIILRECRLR